MKHTRLDKGIKDLIRDNMIKDGYFNRAKVKVHTSKKTYSRKHYKTPDDI